MKLLRFLACLSLVLAMCSCASPEERAKREVEKAYNEAKEEYEKAYEESKQQYDDAYKQAQQEYENALND